MALGAWKWPHFKERRGKELQDTGPPPLQRSPHTPQLCGCPIATPNALQGQGVAQVALRWPCRCHSPGQSQQSRTGSTKASPDPAMA